MASFTTKAPVLRKNNKQLSTNELFIPRKQTNQPGKI
jgi:hypothetical protein